MPGIFKYPPVCVCGLARSTKNNGRHKKAAALSLDALKKPYKETTSLEHIHFNVL